MTNIPSEYDGDVDMNAIEPLSLVECICRRPGMFVSERNLRGILAWLQGYEVATRSAFGDGAIPEHHDTSPMEVRDALARSTGIDRHGKPIHFDLEKIISHFGSEDSVVAAMKRLGEEARDAG